MTTFTDSTPSLDDLDAFEGFEDIADGPTDADLEEIEAEEDEVETVLGRLVGVFVTAGQEANAVGVLGRGLRELHVYLDDRRASAVMLDLADIVDGQ